MTGVTDAGKEKQRRAIDRLPSATQCPVVGNGMVMPGAGRTTKAMPAGATAPPRTASAIVLMVVASEIGSRRHARQSDGADEEGGKPIAAG